VSPRHPSRGSGERRKLPQRDPAENGFYAYFRPERSHLKHHFHYFERRRGPQTSRGPGKLSPLSTGLLVFLHFSGSLSKLKKYKTNKDGNYVINTAKILKSESNPATEVALGLNVWVVKYFIPSLSFLFPRRVYPPTTKALFYLSFPKTPTCPFLPQCFLT